MQEASSLWSMLDKGGVLALSAFFLTAFIKGWIVPRWAYEALKQHCKDIAALSDKNVELATKVSAALEARGDRK